MELVEKQKSGGSLLVVSIANCIFNVFTLMMCLGNVDIVFFIWMLTCLPFSIILANITLKTTLGKSVSLLILLYLISSILMLTLGAWLYALIMKYRFGGESTREEDRLLYIELALVAVNFVLPFIVLVIGSIKYKLIKVK